MLSSSTSSNLAEALINVRRIEKHFMQNEFQSLDRDRNKIRANVDRHKDTFLQLRRQKHETWYRHDRYFRESVRKDKEQHEKRKESHRQQLLLTIIPEHTSRNYTPFQPITPDEPVLPPINTITKTNSSTRTKPMTKVERHTYEVLRASQKLLDESAARPRYKLVLGRPSSTAYNRKNSHQPKPTTSNSEPVPNTTLLVPLTTSLDCGEYDRLTNESLQRETFSEFIDHFVKFRPEFREQFGTIHEENKRQRAIEKLREYNQVHAKTKDGRYHNLLDTLTDLHSEQRKNSIDY